VHGITSRAVADDEIEWLNTQDAARGLGITTRTLYRFIDEGAVPAYKMGRVIRIKKADLDTFIESTRVQPGTMSHLYPPRKPTADDA
jgi:excisionase family DNA binding protein